MTNKELRKAAAAGDAEAQFELAMRSLRRGHSFLEQFAKAYPLLLQAAEQGRAESQVSLGFMYHNALGVPQDYQQARYWYEKAAAQGNADAQYNLGVMYEDGIGVPPDWEKALEWYQKACEGRNEEACEAYEEVTEKLEQGIVPGTKLWPKIDV